MVKKKFVVTIREVYIQPYKVKAKNEDEAIDIVRNGGGELWEDMFEYSHTLDSDSWTVSLEE